jgi:quercetin dioxygenase-like cupin family protein
MKRATIVIRCIRLWSGPDGNSHFQEGVVDLEPGPRGDTLSGKFSVTQVSFQETNADPKLGWHTDPARQLVVTLSGALEFTTHDGSFSLRSGDILFAEDTSGAAHNWALLGDSLGGVSMPFLTTKRSFPFRPTEPAWPSPLRIDATRK